MLVLPVLLGTPAPAGAVGSLRITVDAADGAGWSLRAATVDVELDAPRVRLALREGSLPGAVGTVRGLQVDCPRLEHGAGRYACRGATVDGTLGPLGSQRLVVDAAWDGGAGVRAAARDIALAGGRLAVQVDADARGWRLRADATGVDPAAALAFARPWFAPPQGFDLAGRLDLEVTAEGRGAQPSAARAVLGFAALTVANAAGSIATDGLAGRLDATLAPPLTGGDGSWRWDARLDLPGGQAYLQPVFVDFGQRPATLAAAGAWRPGGLEVDRFSYTQPGAVELRGRASLAVGGDAAARASPASPTPVAPVAPVAPPLVRRAELELVAAEFPGAGAYVGPFLAETPFRGVTARGRVSGTATLVDDAPARLDVRLDGVDLDDPGGALAFARLDGRIRWYGAAERAAVARDDSTPDDAFVSTLAWDSGRLYGLALGGARLRFTTGARDFRLLEPVTIPVFDGGLALETLRLRHVGLPSMWLRLDARVLPISLAPVTRALGWPEFGGTLAGTIPRAALEDGVLTFGGNLEAEVFGGRVVASGLRLEDPLGRFPRLYATLAAEALDLQQVTGTFQFGEITGRLSGRVDGLELSAWQAVRFDARFATPPGDDSRRRISQRAVQNLSSIGGGGGGVAAALQGGVLRFFETFRYDRLGLSCRLANDVCAMGGVGPAPGGGYYIVRGSGLPRIDVIGSGDRVAWTRLVQQLQAATESGGVEVR